MLNISGFIAINSLATNVPGKVSTIGELSNKSESYSKEKGFYKKNAYPDVRLVTFNSTEDGTQLAVPPSFSDEILRIAQGMYSKCITGEFNSSQDAATEALIQSYGSAVTVRHVGNMVTEKGYWMPESLILEFKLLGKPNSVRLWLSDGTFRTQYDLYELVVVPPVDNIDSLVDTVAAVKEIVDGIDVPTHSKRVTIAAGDFPYTYPSTENYQWTDRNDPDVQFPTPWTAIIYGIAGNNSDIIRNAIIDYILAHSQYSREIWEKIYPDLFLPNEFYITPLWDIRSLENLRTVGGIYSPTALVKEQLEAAVSTFFNIPISHINDHAAHSTIDYKSLGFVSIGNWKNRNGNFNLRQQWPEFTNLRTVSLDFNRMSVSTQQFYMLLVNAFKVAEEHDEYSTVPTGMSIVTRGDADYLVFNYEKVQYLISLPDNVITEWEDSGNIGGDAGTQYRIDWTVPDSIGGSTENTSIHVQLMYKPATTNEFRLMDDPEARIYYDAVWYNSAGNVIDTVELINSKVNVLLFDRDLQGLQGSTIRLYAKYSGKLISSTKVLNFV